MFFVEVAAGGLPFLLCITLTFGRVIHLPDPNEVFDIPQVIHSFEGDTHDILDPSEMLAYIHSPDEEECQIHQISRNLLTVTKDLISFAPRTKYRGKPPNTQQKLSLLQSMKPQDVQNVLAQQSIFIPFGSNVTCSHGAQFYRTMDGSCNNLQHPCWGKSNEPYVRWLPPAYSNGIDEPRNKMSKGFPLPHPRAVYEWVSSQFEPRNETAYKHLSNLAVVWGQMVAHDLILTPTVTTRVWNGKELVEEKLDCCDKSFTHPECIHLIMKDDSFYNRGHCMGIVRSSAYVYSPFSCEPYPTLGRTREQMNQITAYLDASLVYGSTDKGLKALRENDGKGAKLIMDYKSGWSYPVRKNSSTCKASTDVCNKACFLAGEKRANENPILAAMHTLWAREHNRLVDLFRNKGWPEETLFHVVRKIVGAMLQHTTYKEYLPQIIGPTLAGIMKLTVPSTDYKYNPSINPTIYNVFVTAAFRYGHSMLTSRNMRAGKTVDGSPLLSNDFFSMDDYCNPQFDPVAVLLYGQLYQNAQKVDCLFSKQMTNHLFAKTPNGKGLDIFSLNIQRGRDHGIPPYNDWRQTCGLPRARDYSDLKGTIPDYIIDRMEKIYGAGNVNEIDLFVGGISEIAVNDGILGPTFTCIVANQFRNLKFGDRFWYENTDHLGAFTSSQITSIQKTTITSLLCRNTDIPELAQSALLLESLSNPRKNCKQLVLETDIDPKLW